jgi:trimethylamine--corrinoid protein Co-methyltransferase
LFSLLNSDEVYRIHMATMEVLERVGILVENGETLDLLASAGAKVDKQKGRARIPEYLIKEACSRAPSSFDIYTRDMKKVRIGPGKTTISFGAGATYVLDLKTGDPRPATKNDVEQLTRLTDAMEHIELCMSPIIQDVTRSLVDVHSAEAMMCNSTKPPWVCPGDARQARYIIEMASAIAGGLGELQTKPIILGLASPNSPLRLASHDLQVAREFVSRKLPITFINCPNNGATSPISIAGTIVQTLAECLSMVLVAQLMNPGNPVAAGPSPPITDMRTATACFGAPECALVTAGSAEMMRYYNIPSYASITSSDSIGIDAQTGYEIAWTAQLPMMAGVNLVNGIGLMGFCEISSYEKVVIDNEVFGGLRRILRGIEVSDASLAVDAIEAVGPAGHYLSQKHTREQLLKERWFPKISNRLSIAEWKKEKVDLWQRARKEVMNILATHQPNPLEKEKRERIREIVNEAERAVAKS